MIDHRSVFGLLLVTVGVVLDDRSDALVGERADINGMGGDGLGPLWLEAAVQTKHAKAGSEALLGMRPIGEDRDDQPFGLGAESPRPALETLGRPVGIAPMAFGI